MVHRRFLLASVGLAMLAAAVLAAPPAESDSGGLSVENAWIPQPPPGTGVAAAYFTLRNDSHAPAVLVAVSSPLAGDTMLHETTVVGGMSRMRMVARLTVPPHGSVTLRPDGLHVMLLSLKQALIPGETVPLVLRFASGREIRVVAHVRPIGRE